MRTVVLASPRDGGRPPSASQQAPKLLDRMRNLMRVLHYGRKTEQVYCHWVKRFIFFHGCDTPAAWARAK